MNGKFLLGFAIGVIGASAVAYRESPPGWPAVPGIFSSAIPSAPVASGTSTLPSKPNSTQGSTQNQTQNVPDTPEPPAPADPAPTPDAAAATPSAAAPSDDAAQTSSPLGPSETHPQIDVPEAHPRVASKRKPLPSHQSNTRGVPLPHYESLPIPQQNLERHVEQKPMEPEQDPATQPVPDSERNVSKPAAPLMQAAPPPDAPAPAPSSSAGPASTPGQRAPGVAASPSTPPAAAFSAPAQSAPASEWHTLSGPRRLPTSAPNPPVNSSSRTPGVNLIPRESPILTPRPGVSGPVSAQPSGPIASLRPEAAPEISARPERSVPSRIPNTVTLAAGTPLPIRLGEKLSSDQNHAGDNFFAALDQPLVVDGFVIAERGERVEGRIADTRAPGHRGTPELCVELTSFRTSDGQVVAIHTAPYVRQDSKHSATGKVSGGVVIGAAIGAIAGAGVGAAIGAGVGGAAGMGTALVARHKPIVIPVETLLTFRLDQPVTITEHIDQHTDQRRPE